MIDINCCTIDNEINGLLTRNYRMRVLITTRAEETILNSVSSIITWKFENV